MKIICASCHKKFDNDKYYGICPKCGAFNRINYSEEEDHKRFHEMYDDTNGTRNMESMSIIMRNMTIPRRMRMCLLQREE